MIGHFSRMQADFFFNDLRPRVDLAILQPTVQDQTRSCLQLKEQQEDLSQNLQPHLAETTMRMQFNRIHRSASAGRQR